MKIQISYSAVFKILGWLLLVEAAIMLIPFAVNIFEGEKVIGFILGIGCAGISGILLTWRCRFDRVHIGRREGFMLVSLAWIVFSLFGMLPFMFCNTPLSLSDAFFETISGFTTTGATTISDVEVLSKGILLWRAMTQWIGGLGIILFLLAILPSLNDRGGIPMYNAEVTGITHDKLHPRIRYTAMSLWLIYLMVTILMIVLLWAGPMDFFDAVCQSLTTISTGGFSTRNSSIAWWNSDYTSIVITVFMFIGGINFSLIYAARKGNVASLLRNDVFRAYCLIVFVAYAVTALSMAFHGEISDFHDAFTAPLFHIVSSITTTGFSLDDFSAWGQFVLLVTMLVMLSGACAGSTTGAIKVDRLVALRHNLGNEIKRSINPRRVYIVRVNGNVLPTADLSRVTAFVTIYCILVLLGALAVSAFGYNLVDSFFAVISCLGNNGLGYGITGSAGGFHLLPDFLKWLLSLFMLIGRLELFSILVMLYPYFWRK